jgi:hypothetical protein
MIGRKVQHLLRPKNLEGSSGICSCSDGCRSAVLSAMPVLSAAAVMVAVPPAVLSATPVLSAAAVFVAATLQVAAQTLSFTDDADNACVLLLYGGIEILITNHAQTPNLKRVSVTTAHVHVPFLHVHFQGHSCKKGHRYQGLSCKHQNYRIVG